jgi:hypothetical protein
MTWNWNAPPEAPGSRRRSLRKLFTSLLVGVMSVGIAWAGAGLVPVNLDDAGSQTPATPSHRRAAGTQGTDEAAVVSADASLAAGQVLAGAAKVSIEPRPEAYGGTWLHGEPGQDSEAYKKCATLSDNPEGFQEGATHVADFRVRWAENPNCLYMGGYGIGPMNPITNWEDPYGLWVRSVALNDGTDTVVLTLIDGVYYFGKYNEMCDDCGFFDLQQSLGGELGIAPEGLMFASTHSHTSVDFIGGWGGAPQWYMDQVEDSIKTSVREAVTSMRPATLEMGEVIVRERNGERRDFYRSAEEQNLAWFRAVEIAAPPPPPPSPSPTWTPHPKCQAPPHQDDPECQPPPAPSPAPPAPGNAIATVAAYAAHPVTEDTESGTADADFPAVFSDNVEKAYGGTGFLFQTGFGNMSPRGDKEEMGDGLAAALPPLGTGTPIANPDVSSAQAFWDQPVTNSGLLALGLPGFFDRPFNQLPAQVSAGKNGERKCNSASPISVRTAVSAAKVGPLWITGAPGEIFANYSNSLKERNPNGITMPLTLVNDGLGYIMQSFETDHVGRQAVGFVGEPLAEYEDAYSIDACFGDMALETTIGLLGNL